MATIAVRCLAPADTIINILNAPRRTSADWVVARESCWAGRGGGKSQK